MKQYITIGALTLISIIGIFVTKEMGGAFLLWISYGGYKIIKIWSTL